jgi:hypothetical protein
LTAESDKGQLDAYVKSAEWDLEGTTTVWDVDYRFLLFRSIEDFVAASNTLKYDCCPDLYPYVIYTLRIRRRSLYYFTNIVGKTNLIRPIHNESEYTTQNGILIFSAMFSH